MIKFIRSGMTSLKNKFIIRVYVLVISIFQHRFICKTIEMRATNNW